MPEWLWGALIGAAVVVGVMCAAWPEVREMVGFAVTSALGAPFLAAGWCLKPVGRWLTRHGPFTVYTRMDRQAMRRFANVLEHAHVVAWRRGSIMLFVERKTERQPGEPVPLSYFFPKVKDDEAGDA